MATTDEERGGATYNIEESVKSLLKSKDQRLEYDHHRLPSIQMVPQAFRDLSPTSFNPRVVSIGPLHFKDENLKKFEGRKLTYLHNLMGRLNSPPEETLAACVQKVSRSIKRIRASYIGMDEYNDVALTEMMVTDGCFILEFIQLYSTRDITLRKSLLITQLILYDLLLIENQLPFFVLKDIFKCTISKIQPMFSVTKHIKALLKFYKVFDEKLVMDKVIDQDTNHDHILGLVHKAFQPQPDTLLTSDKVPKSHSAMDLDRAGVNFKPNEDANWAMAIKVELSRFSRFPWFLQKPTLKIPVVSIHDFTDLVLRNLITYEQCFLDSNYVTAYAFAMDMLIDTPEDVGVLVKSKVLVNKIGTNQNAAEMINNLCTDVPVLDFFYHQEWKKLDEYYNASLPNLAAGLKRRYFNSPWNIIALFAGIVLFGLTVVQTIYTIKAS